MRKVQLLRLLPPRSAAALSAAACSVHPRYLPSFQSIRNLIVMDERECDSGSICSPTAVDGEKGSSELSQDT